MGIKTQQELVLPETVHSDEVKCKFANVYLF